MEIEMGSSGRSYSAAERLMLFIGDVRWLSDSLYDEHGVCRFPVERMLPSHQLPATLALSRLTRDMDQAESELRGPRDGRRLGEASSLRYLANRLESVDSVDTRALAQKVRAVLNGPDLAAAEREGFYNCLWAGVTRSLDREDFAPEHRDLLSALEVELAGHVYGSRLAEGKLVRREFAPGAEVKTRGIFRRFFAS
ncbi:hypothetical protein [Paraburkholderia fungorum]|uniref:hypothetical protein n=1 Tax=Paraburkholderia fungorum TaxID=134537 RepID=UPI00160DEDF0|nr:hypothetical protein [Paraburkholderia fungorum]MBB5546659.1 hypothetical protein [Paraburkholderia fungorum]